MSDKSESATLSADVRKLLAEAERALGHTDNAGEEFDELRERIRTVVDDGRNSFARLRSETMRRAKQADQVVRGNPYYAIGIAAGVGAIVGALLARRGSSSR